MDSRPSIRQGLPPEPVSLRGLPSMWLGFFAWYGGLAMGGIVRVSQVQLIQPFLALLFAVPVLGERLDPVTLAFALAVIGVVFVSRRLSVGQAQRR